MSKVTGFIFNAVLFNSVPAYKHMAADAFKARMHLLSESWLSDPMGTLPDNDEILARIAMVDAKTWKRIKKQALYNFESDEGGRIFEADIMKQAQHLKNKKVAGETGWTTPRRKMMARVIAENAAKAHDEAAAVAAHEAH